MEEEMTDDRGLRWYTVWSDEHPGHTPETIQESRPSLAAKHWFDGHWCGLGRPDEARVFVRYAEGDELFAFDVYVDDIELDLGVTNVSFDGNGKPVDLAPIDPGEKPAAPSVSFDFGVDADEEDTDK
jgi:hypothetical protein